MFAGLRTGGVADLDPSPRAMRYTDVGRVRDAAEPVLRLENVTLRYATPDRLITAIHRVSFHMRERDRLILLGPSGCGKSSLLKAVGGFIRPDEGSIRLKGREITRPGPDRMMVFQDFEQLLPWKTVIGNVASALFVSRRWTRAAALERAHAALAKVGLTRCATDYPHTLSGGMKQRVAIARAMAMEPEILLMDEPYAALDALTRRNMQDELLELWRDLPFTLLFVTHSIEEAILIGSRIIVLSPHPGRIRAHYDCDRLDHAAQGGEAFRSLHLRIHELLFTPEGESSCR